MPRAGRSSRRSTGTATACTRTPPTRRSGAAGAWRRPGAHPRPRARRRTGYEPRGDRARRRRHEGRAARLRAAPQARARGSLVLRARRRDLRLRRTERRGQDHDAQDPDGPHPRDFGIGARARPRRRRDRVPPPRRLPAREPLLLRLSHRSRDARLLRRAVRPLARAAPRARRRAARPGRARARGGRARSQLQQGYAAAARDRAGDRPRPRRGVPRRADERARPDRTQGGARSDPAAARAAQDRVHEHAHPARRGARMRSRGDHRARSDPLRGRDPGFRRGRRAPDRPVARERSRARRRAARGALRRAAARGGRSDRGARAREARRRRARAAARGRRARGLGVAAPRLARADLHERGRGEPEVTAPRGEFVVGKFRGLPLTIWLQTAIMGVAFAGVSIATGAKLGVPHLAFFFLTGVELALVVGIATFFSAFTTPVLAAFFTTGIWGVGHLSRQLRDLGANTDSIPLQWATWLLHRVLPDLESFNLASEAAHLLPV